MNYSKKVKYLPIKNIFFSGFPSVFCSQMKFVLVL